MRDKIGVDLFLLRDCVPDRIRGRRIVSARVSDHGNCRSNGACWHLVRRIAASLRAFWAT